MSCGFGGFTGLVIAGVRVRVQRPTSCLAQRSSARSRVERGPGVVSRVRRGPPGSTGRCRGTPSSPSRNRSTAASFAAFSTAPARSAAAGHLEPQVEGRERLAVGLLEVQRRERLPVEPLRRAGNALRVGQGDTGSAAACPAARAGPAPSRRRTRRTSERSTPGERSRRSASAGRPNSQRASITSSALFISVAESTVIFGPICQVGCRSACSRRDALQFGRASCRGTARRWR